MKNWLLVRTDDGDDIEVYRKNLYTYADVVKTRDSWLKTEGTWAITKYGWVLIYRDLPDEHSMLLFVNVL